jgi:primary-amine oxidase
MVRRRWLRSSLHLTFFLAVHGGLGAQSPATHPLDGLTSQEFWTLYDVLRQSGRTDSAAQFAMVQLHEPPKAEVLAWKAGASFRREASAVVRQGPKTFEAVVDLTGRKLLSWKEAAGMQSNMTGAEDDAIGDLIKSDSRVRDALRKRGFTDLTTIGCWAIPLGYFAQPESEGRRLFKGGCASRHGVYNAQARGIPGLTVWVDADARKILKVVDTGGPALPTASDDFDREAVGATRTPMPPFDLRQPQGPGYRVDGGQVSWGNWRFHVRLDQRVGVVVSMVRYVDGDRERSVMYQGHLSEIFVPYMDSTTGWYERVFLDAGEYAAEGLAEPLEPGVDCPAGAAYFDDIVANDKGLPKRRRRLACLFERTTGVVAWRHGQDGGERVDGRPARELVLRMNATVGNYDYLFDWVFQQNGAIRVAVGATGILEVKVVGSQSATGAPASTADLAFGHLLAPGVLGVNHDHFFSFRLDMDVDGPRNSLAVDQMRTQKLPASHPRRSLWKVEERIPATEKDAQLDIDMRQPALWRVISADHQGQLGYPTSYEIQPSHNAMSLLTPDDWPQRRAGFSMHHLWVTPYNPDELYAAGDYPTLSKGDYGLPTWTRANRGIEGTDIVVWYTLGFHHAPRAEDWPVMPVAWHSFEIRPFDFFPRNPTLDLPGTP